MYDFITLAYFIAPVLRHSVYIIDSSIEISPEINTRQVGARRTQYDLSAFDSRYIALNDFCRQWFYQCLE